MFRVTEVFHRVSFPEKSLHPYVRIRGRVANERHKISKSRVESRGRSPKAPVERAMSEVVYISKSRIERKRGPVRIAHLPGEPQPVVYSVHGAIAEHYKVIRRN